MTDEIAEESIEIITEMKVMTEVEMGTVLERGHFPETLVVIEIESTSNSRSRSRSTASMNRDRIRCCNCREYDHFAKDCPTSREERELEQLQQMLNLEDEQSSLKSLVKNKQDNFNRVNSEENLRLGHLNL